LEIIFTESFQEIYSMDSMKTSKRETQTSRTTNPTISSNRASFKLQKLNVVNKFTEPVWSRHTEIHHVKVDGRKKEFVESSCLGIV